MIVFKVCPSLLLLPFLPGVFNVDGPGTVSLLSFCASTTPPIHFAFTSSISTTLGPPPPTPHPPLGLFPTKAPIPESPPSLHHTYVQTGYAQSKYITERLLSSLFQTTAFRTTSSQTTVPPLPITLLRIGQLCGHTRTSYWNAQEWFPILIASVRAVGALPVLDTHVDWVPVDVAARCCVEILVGGDGGEGGINEDKAAEQEQDEGIQVYNIVNPHPVPWTTLLSLLQKTSLAPHSLEEVCMEEWIRRLEALSSSTSTSISTSSPSPANDLPAHRLTAFYTSLATDPNAGRAFETTRARARSEALRTCPPVGEAWVEGWVGGWRGVGGL